MPSRSNTLPPLVVRRGNGRRLGAKRGTGEDRGMRRGRGRGAAGWQCPFAREIERGAGWRANRLFEKRVKAGRRGAAGESSEGKARFAFWKSIQRNSSFPSGCIAPFHYEEKERFHRWRFLGVSDFAIPRRRRGGRSGLKAKAAYAPAVSSPSPLREVENHCWVVSR